MPIMKPNKRSVSGFSLTEMLVTLLIMTLVSTLLATGIPVAIDTYHKTVNSANAQIALSTTLTVLRSEIGTSTDVRVVGGKIYYVTDEGYWASIGNPTPHGDATFRGLEKQYYTGTPESVTADSITGLTKMEDLCLPVVSDSAITQPLHVTFSVETLNAGDKQVTISSLLVKDGVESTSNELAKVTDYKILLRFVK